MGVTFANAFTCGNILLNFAPDDLLITVCRGSLTLVLLGTFPLFILPCRLTVHRYFWTYSLSLFGILDHVLSLSQGSSCLLSLSLSVCPQSLFTLNY